jgi:hypothetical protein
MVWMNPCGLPAATLSLYALPRQLRSLHLPVRWCSGTLSSTRFSGEPTARANLLPYEHLRYYARRCGSASRRALQGTPVKARNPGQSCCARWSESLFQSRHFGHCAPEKPSGHLPSPERWPSAPNGQSLASRMVLCPHTPERSRCTEPVRWDPHLYIGRVYIPKTEHPSLRSLAERGNPI